MSEEITQAIPRSSPATGAVTVKSYSSGKASFSAFLRESLSLRKSYAGKASAKVRAAIADMERAESLVQERIGLALRGLEILEIGPGQFLSQMIYLSRHNKVVAIDLEVITRGANPLCYLRMLRNNGARRTVKTIGRKVLGIDRQYSSEIMRQLGLSTLPPLPVLQMDACDLKFAGSSFDFVYSRSVFHHLPNPAVALEAITRVLRPGGGAYILLHLYSSETGCLDPRIYTSQRHEVEGWLHLRPETQGLLNNHGTFVNQLRLREWQDLFQSKMPGAQIVAGRSDEATLERARSLQEQGHLLEYSLEELTTVDLAVVWRKPKRVESPAQPESQNSASRN